MEPGAGSPEPFRPGRPAIRRRNMLREILEAPLRSSDDPDDIIGGF